MNRLTEKGIKLGFVKSNTLPSYEGLYERLSKYEDLEEQGRLLKLPCKLGDMLYYPDEFTNKIRWNCAEKIEIDSSGIFVIDTSGWIHSGRTFGETTFLTKSEAEQVLKKAKGGNQ